MKLPEKTKYLLWAAARWPSADRACPGCGSEAAELIKRKHWVTSLYRCRMCQLMFRVPKGSLVADGAFYDSEYEEGPTTELPDDAHLDMLKANSFRDIGKDYSGYIAMLQTLGIQPGSSIYDYGSSWGYGSWQFRNAGYRVYSYDVAVRRARFAEEKLGCPSVRHPTALPEAVDCMFASHVIEHLADPNLLWRTALGVLKPSGVLVLVTPNGEPSQESRNWAHYHQLWGRVHPLLLTAASLTWMARRYGFDGNAHSSPYELGQIGGGSQGSLNGEELLFVGRRGSARPGSL